MTDRIDRYKKKIEVEWTWEHSSRTLTVKGLMRNTGPETVNLAELKALYRNFDGFVTDVDTLSCEGTLAPGGTQGFMFPERPRPVGFSSGEVVVSRVALK